jgi:parallel beta-helix repeat protein
MVAVNKKIVLFLVFILLIIGIASVVFLYVANPPEEATFSGTITGRVINATSGAPIQFASVTATGSAGFGSDTTDANGDYIMNTGLGNGAYTVNVTATGFVSQERYGVNVMINQVTSNIDFLLTTVAPSRKIYIRSDGSVDPANASIQKVGNNYKFTDEIFGEIVVERQSIIIDGNGFKLEGSGVGIGVDLNYAGNATFGNVTIQNIDIQNYATGIIAGANNTLFENIITGSFKGIDLTGDDCFISGNRITDNGVAIGSLGSSRNVISGNEISNNEYGFQGTPNYSLISYNNITSNKFHGLYFLYSVNNTISGNIIANNGWAAIHFVNSWNNNIFKNKISDNGQGIDFFFDTTPSYNNTITSNNFINNTVQVLNGNVSVNFWDDGVRGNYWSDYKGIDANRDGIGDTPYVIDANNQDRYPLIEPDSIP